jgi:2-amino-4-hydroxy-6-hydroxymethyldihydropteridine diphosphokinase
MRRVVFGLGSNLGDRAATLRSAIAQLRRQQGVESLSSSSFYETSPVGGPIQGNYLNAAVVFQTGLRPDQLLTMAMAIEQAHARVRREKNGPRTLDVDVLWIEGQRVREAQLQVPHPRMHERAFALRPLLELVPMAIDPRNGVKIREYLKRIGEEGTWQYREAVREGVGAAPEQFTI